MENFAPRDGETIHGRTHSAFLATHYANIWNFVIDHSFEDAKLKFPGGQAEWLEAPTGVDPTSLGRTWKESPEGILALEDPILTAEREARTEAGFLDLPIAEIEIVQKFSRNGRNGEYDDYLCILPSDYLPSQETKQHLDTDEDIEVVCMSEVEIVQNWDKIHWKYKEYLTYLPLGNREEIQAMYDQEVWERDQRRSRGYRRS